jgi:hypothetical protein
MPKSTAVINPNLGLYIDRPPIACPPGALQDGLNFRIQEGRLNNLNLGWSSFGPFTLNGAVTLIASLTTRVGVTSLIFGTPTDLYLYSTGGSGSVTYLSPRYATGTVAASGTAVTGTGTLWATTPGGGTRHNARAGDQISFGNNAQNNPSATWYTIQTVNTDTSITLTASAGTVTGGTAYTIRQTFAGTAATPWTYDVFVNAQPSSTDNIYFTNGVDPVVRWDGTSSTVSILNLNGQSIICQTLAVYKNQLLLANIVQSGTIKPTDLLNSDVSSPEVFNSGLAGQFKVSGLTDQIVRLARLGDYLVIYLKSDIILANFVGDPLVYTFQTISNGKGLASTRGVALYPSYHEFIGADNLYIFDGSNVRPMSNHVWREVIRTEDPARTSMVFNHLDESRGDYIWSVPLTTDPGAGTITSPPVVAFVEHYLETLNEAGFQLLGSTRPHSKRSFPFTSSGTYARQSTLTWNQLTNAWQTYNFKWNDQFFAASFPLSIVGDVNGSVWVLNGSQDANGAGLNSYVTFGRRATIDGKNRGLVTRIYPFMTQFSTPVNVTANLADFAIGPATIMQTASYDQTLPEGLFFAPIYRVGRYIDVQIGSAGPGQPWEVSGYDLAVTPGGMR